MSKKIVILAETIDVNSSSAGKANMGFVNALNEVGYHIFVYHYSYKNIIIKGVETKLIKEKKTSLNYFLSRGQRVLQRITKKNFSKRLEDKNGFSFSFKSDAKSMASTLKNHKEDFDLIITLSKAASFRTHAALLMLPKFHKKWLAYVHDPYPFHRYPPPYNWVEAGHQQKEDFFREVSVKAKYSGFPSELLMQWMGNFFPNFLKTGIVLPHQDLVKYKNNETPPAYLALEKFSLMHAGNLLDHRNPFPLVKGFLLFLQKHPEAISTSQLLLIGPSKPHDPELTNECNKIDSIYKSEGYVPFIEVQSLQQHASVLIILEAVSEISPFLPGKFPHYVKATKPILHLGPQKSETARLLGDKYPFTTEADNIVVISEKISKLYQLWKSNPTLLKLKRPDLEHYISPSYLKEQMDIIFE